MLTNQAINIASELAEQYGISSIQPLIASCREIEHSDSLNLAVTGRFKAGKSSFLNNFLGREVLPVGVVPVTTVVTEISFGPEEKATIHFLSGERKMVDLDQVRSFIAESENPGNLKGISTVVIELPELAQFRALRFVDMPGLDSTFAHNTETALKWLPRVALALVAVAVDPPLSQYDIALIRSLYEYTPKVSLLLTKVDLLTPVEQQEVHLFVTERLKEAFGTAPEIFQYSIKPGHEHLRATIKSTLIEPLLTGFQEQRDAVLDRKVETLLRECGDYLTLALKSAGTVESEREKLRLEVLENKEGIDDLKSELRLIVQHTAARTRSDIAKRLDRHRSELDRRLLAELDFNFPEWNSSFAFALNSYQTWLEQILSEELVAISATDRKDLLVPLDKLEIQVFRSLQNFRDRLSDRAVRAFGVPLRTFEQKIRLHESHTPDIHIGHIFDRSWELLSPVLPMSLAGPSVLGHFKRKLPYIIEKNLSRLATQWDESIRGAMTELVNEAHRRIDQLVGTIGLLISTSSDDAPQIREDLERLQLCRPNLISVNAK